MKQTILNYLKYVIFYTILTTVVLSLILAFLAFHIGIVIYAFFKFGVIGIPVTIASCLSGWYIINNTVDNLDKLEALVVKFIIED